MTACLMFYATGHGEETWEYLPKVWKNPVPHLNEIQREMACFQPDDYEKDRTLAFKLQNFAYAINQEIIKAESPNWANPSAERKAVIEKWGNTLKPYTADLVKLALDNETRGTGAGRQSRSLLDFAAPTQAFADQTRAYLKKSFWEAFAAAGLLYEHRLLTDTDKQVLRDWRPDSDSELESWAVGVSEFGMQDGLEVAKKALSKKPQGETPEEIFGQYGNSLGIAGSLGTEASVVLLDIEALIANSTIKSSGYLTIFENVRDIVAGKKPLQGRYAKNGSGPLSPWLKSEGTEKQERDASASEPSQNSKRSTQQEPNPTTQVEKSPLPTRWQLVAVFIAVALGLLWVLLKKRK